MMMINMMTLMMINITYWINDSHRLVTVTYPAHLLTTPDIYIHCHNYFILASYQCTNLFRICLFVLCKPYVSIEPYFIFLCAIPNDSLKILSRGFKIKY